ncbi:MAG: hypothetical protein EBV84_15080 [Betaproteobacteria bacterium]|nr:hypothetical protein [Betaproteobacteria bacterium]
MKGRNISVHELGVGNNVGIDIVVFAVTHGGQIKFQCRGPGNNKAEVEEETVENRRVQVKPSGTDLVLTTKISGVNQDRRTKGRQYVGRTDKSEIGGVVVDGQGKGRDSNGIL